ncbi:hypothetical protein [Mucilaginibacter segetis]|uniref:Uncharacterized protein n=1 Tax=Mucilaginibacter segetis TaxID=2793071 RepID=A0A934PV30_9SPHI|nr:hypothetical protein [Mucilaginibacter segetis]MBK0379558.1 hypothetical protein [Mucilaginibacter segetis]
MKRIIIFSLLLVAATAFITVKYFRSLNNSGEHSANILRNIPDNAAAVFEFSNDKGFYDIFTDNTLVGNLIGEEKIGELDTVRKVFFGDATLQGFFNNSNVFVSLHPDTSQSSGTELLITAAAAKNFDIEIFNSLLKKKKSGYVITPLNINGKKGYTVYFTSLKKRFYIINKSGNIFSASFSKNLITRSAAYKTDNDNHAFLLLPDKQNANSLANLYVNYTQLSPVFEQLLKNRYSDIFKSFRLLPALGALNLNYKTDALMFNGYTNIINNKPASYLNLFRDQQPVVNKLKEVFPSTTAYAMSMGVSDPEKFMHDLSRFYDKAGLKGEEDTLFNKVKNETGINLHTEFGKLLGNEFALVTTRYHEKLGIVATTNGLKLRPFMTNISTMVDDNTGRFKYDKLPYFLLGDAFSILKRPYFRIIDNYLILANSIHELDSYNDIYFNRKFLNKAENYIDFDNLTAERSNVSFIMYFKNAQPILKGDLKDNIYSNYKNSSLSLKNFYAASYQLSAADRNFYTNFCMLKNVQDSTSVKNTKNQ